MSENRVSILSGYGARAAGAAVRSFLQTSHETAQARGGLSLLFAAGERPSAMDVERLLAGGETPGPRARISHRPDDSQGWIEVLASGLTFDLAGLAPAKGLSLPEIEYQFGISFDPDRFGLEAVTLFPGGHIAGGGGMIPVVRTMIGLAAAMALTLEVKAVCWHPARSCMEPGYFTRLAGNWLSGGPFPALGLTAVTATERGVMVSVGLDFFAGQEVRFEKQGELPRAEVVKRVVRVINHIVDQGPITALQEIRDSDGRSLLAEPSRDGRHVRVWRSAA